jgi:hypothetical protein
MMGPIDYLVVLFPGNQFNGKIAPVLSKLEKEGIIRVIDLIFITKDKEGKVGTMEIRNLGCEVGDSFKVFSHNLKEWLSLDDIETIAATLPVNTSSVAMLFENLWALKLKEAAMDGGAQILAQGRIPHELVVEAMKERAAQEVTR